jgi:hypothetical protein
MSPSTRAAYDELLLRAAHDWKFSPARKQGVPVRFLKLIDIRLKADAQ